MKALIEQKRITRLKEVRAQEKEAASLLRNKVKKRRDEHAKKLSAQLEREFEENKENEFRVLEEEYQRRVNQIGTAHALNGKENYGIKKELSEKALSDVKRRYKRACVQVLQEQVARNAPVVQRENWRKKVNEMEEERKEEVLAQPKPEHPDVIAKLKPIRVGGVNNSTRSTAETFLNTRYHLGESNFTWYPEVIVEKVSEEDQIDARIAADEEENRVKIAQEVHDRQIEERKEKAEIRHLYAKNDVILKQEQYNLIEELKCLELKDRNTRCEKNIPKKVFQPPYQRYEEVKERRTQLEHAFENIYNVKKDDIQEFQLPNFIETKVSTTNEVNEEDENSQIENDLPEMDGSPCSAPTTTKTLIEPFEAIPLVEPDTSNVPTRDSVVEDTDDSGERDTENIVCTVPRHVLIGDDDGNRSSQISSKRSSIDLNSPAGSDSLVSMNIESACGSASTHDDGNVLLTDDMFLAGTTRKMSRDNQQDGYMESISEYVKDRLANLQKQRSAGLQRNQVAVTWSDDIDHHESSLSRSDVSESHTTSSTVDFVVNEGDTKPDVVVVDEDASSSTQVENESDSTIDIPLEIYAKKAIGRDSVFRDPRLLELSSRLNDKLNRLEKGTKSIDKGLKSQSPVHSSHKVSTTSDSSSSDHVFTHVSDLTTSTVTDSSSSEFGSKRSLSKTMLELQRVRTKKEELRKDYSALIAKMQNYRTELQVKGERFTRRQTDHHLTQINEENGNHINDDILRQSSSSKQTEVEETSAKHTRGSESETRVSIPRPTVPPPPSSLDESVSLARKEDVQVWTHSKILGNYSLDLSHPEIDVESRLEYTIPNYSEASNITNEDSPSTVMLSSISTPSLMEPSIVAVTTPSVIPPSLTSTSLADPSITEPRVVPITVAIPDVVLPSMVVPNEITPSITLPSLLTISVPSVTVHDVTASTTGTSFTFATSAAVSSAAATSIENVSFSDIELSHLHFDQTQQETDLSKYLFDDSFHPETPVTEPLHVITEALGTNTSGKLKPLKCVESPSTMYKSLPNAIETSPNRPPTFSNDVSEKLFESKTMERSNGRSINNSSVRSTTFDDKLSPFEYSSIMSLQEQRLSSAAGYPDTTETSELTEVSIREASRTNIQEVSDMNGLSPECNDAVSSPLFSADDPISALSGFVPIRNNMDIVLCDGDQPSPPIQFFPLNKWTQSVTDINSDYVPTRLIPETSVIESGNTEDGLSPGINSGIGTTLASTQSELRVSNLDSATQSDLRVSQLNDNDQSDSAIPVSTYPNVSYTSFSNIIEMKSSSSPTLSIDVLASINGDLTFASSIPPGADHVQMFPPQSGILFESTSPNGMSPKRISPHNSSPTLSSLGISSQMTSLQLLPQKESQIKLQTESEPLLATGTVAAVLQKPIVTSIYHDTPSAIDTVPSPTFTVPSPTFTESLLPVSEYLSELPATVSHPPLTTSPTEVPSQTIECPLLPMTTEPSAVLSSSMDSLSSSTRYKEQLDLINELSERYRSEQRKIIESYEKLKEGLMSDSSVTLVSDRSHHTLPHPKESNEVKKSGTVESVSLLPGSHGDSAISNIDGNMVDDYQAGDIVHSVVEERGTAHDRIPQLNRVDSQDSDILMDKKFMSMYEGLTTPDATFFGRSVVVESDTIPTSICLTDVSYRTLPAVKDGGKPTHRDISNANDNQVDNNNTVQVDHSHEKMDISVDDNTGPTSIVKNSTVNEEQKNKLLMSFFQGMSPDITLVDHTSTENDYHSMFNFTQESYRNLPGNVRNYLDTLQHIEPVSGDEESLTRGRLESNQSLSEVGDVPNPDQSVNQQTVFSPKFTQSSSPAYISLCKQALASEEHTVENIPSSIPDHSTCIPDLTQEVLVTHEVPHSLSSVYLRGPIDSPSPIYNQGSLNSEGTISELVNLKISSFSNDSVEVADLLKVNQPPDEESINQIQSHSLAVIEPPTNQVGAQFPTNNRTVNQREPYLPGKTVSRNRATLSSKPSKSDSDTSELFTVGKLKLTGTSNKKKSRPPKGVAREALRLVTNGDGKPGSDDKKTADTSTGTSSTERSNKPDGRDVKRRNPSSGGLKKTKQGNGSQKKQVKFK